MYIQRLKRISEFIDSTPPDNICNVRFRQIHLYNNKIVVYNYNLFVYIHLCNYTYYHVLGLVEVVPKSVGGVNALGPGGVFIRRPVVVCVSE